MAIGLKQKSLIPDNPREQEIVHSNGEINHYYYLFFDKLISALQGILTPEGFVMPQQSATNISKLTSNNSIANIVYDSTNNAFNGNIIYVLNAMMMTTFHAWTQIATILNYAGNPSGNLAGNLNQFCLDTTDKTLYICTATGDASTATWTLV